MLSALLYIKGVPGEAQDSMYKEWIEIEGWNFGENQSGSSAFGAGSGAGKVSMQDFQFHKHFDKSSIKLFEKCATGEQISDASLLVRRSGASSGDLENYYRVDFKDLIISHYSTSGGAGDSGLPAESIAFNFAAHTSTYFIQKDGQLVGQLGTSYSVKTGEQM